MRKNITYYDGYSLQHVLALVRSEFFRLNDYAAVDYSTPAGADHRISRISVVDQICLPK